MKASELERRMRRFVEDWKDMPHDEKKETQKFWNALLGEVYGIKELTHYIDYEKNVFIDTTHFIDGYIPTTKVLIEQKSSNVDLDKAAKQSDGAILTPYEQAKRYAEKLPHDENPRWIITCNFDEFRIYDLNLARPEKSPTTVKLKELVNDYYLLNFAINPNEEDVRQELKVSVKAGDIIGEIYDAFLKEYKNPEDPHSLKSLNILCVRLVFCLYAEDADIFDGHNKFGNYLKTFNNESVRQGLIKLFEVLNTKPDDRDPYLRADLASFPYVNGGLFADKDKNGNPLNIEIPTITTEILDLLIRKASEGFNWRGISPTIFGAIFESTMNPETRRSGGMHYTSLENIHKVINPLFLDELNAEFRAIKDNPIVADRNSRLKAFQNKLAGLTFLDPACGSGNFLTETYICLRRLENQLLQLLYDTDKIKFKKHDIKVSIGHFYGIEINDFAVAVAKTALWIAEAQMMSELEIGQTEVLPLQDFDNIKEANALTTDWAEVIPSNKLNYIMGNPPFVGARMKDKEQTKEVENIFGKDWKGWGNLDYVACWYKKAADYITDTNIHCAFVSTNSITQGEQVAILWKTLFENGLHFDFAHRTFIWDSEASLKAHVYCVIIGFSKSNDKKQKLIFTSTKNEETVTSIAQNATNINPYLLDAENVFVESRDTPICEMPPIGIGNQPIDNGNYLFDETEYQAFIRKEPKAAKYFRRIFGAEEFINRKTRYCLWLGECLPEELIQMPECMKRVDAVRKFRLASKRAGTVKLAEKPTRFLVENMPSSTYIVTPETSSQQRAYIPMGFFNPEILCTNSMKLVQNASKYHFAVLTSSVHMAWMRAVCGRLKSDYRYSKDIVYNNFPWPALSDNQKEELNKTAQAILDARNEHPFLSLAEMYGEHMYLYTDLVNAHRANDKAVLKAYGLKADTTEEEIVAFLMKRYQELTAEKQ